MTIQDAVNSLRAEQKLTSNMTDMERNVAIAWATRCLLRTQQNGECDMATYREIEWTFTLANINLILAEDSASRDIITSILGDEC